MVQKVLFSGQFSYSRDLSGNTNTLRPAGLHQPDWAGFPQPGQVHFPEPSAIHGPPPQGLIRALWYMPSTPNPVQANSSQWGFRVQGGQETITFPLWGTSTEGWAETGRWPKCLGTAPPGFWESQPGRSKRQKHLLGHWQIPITGTERGEITKETSNGAGGF